MTYRDCLIKLNKGRKAFFSILTLIGLSVNGANGTQNPTTASYDGAFNIGTEYHIGVITKERFWIKNIRVYPKDMGQTFCERETA